MKIYVNFGNGSEGLASPWTDNDFTSSLSVGLAKADLVASDGSNSGVSFYVENDDLLVSSNTSYATLSAGEFSVDALSRYSYFAGSTEPHIKLTNLPANTPITFSAVGIKNGNAYAVRDTEFTVNGNNYIYDNTGVALAQTPPVSFTENSDSSGDLLIELTATDTPTYGFLNALTLEYSTVTGPSIDNIDGDNEVRAGQQNVVITGTDLGAATAATLGNENLTIA